MRLYSHVCHIVHDAVEYDNDSCTMADADQMALSLHLLPIELVHRILDHLDQVDILVSMRNVCTRLNDVIDIYDPYEVNSIEHRELPYIFPTWNRRRSTAHRCAITRHS